MLPQPLDYAKTSPPGVTLLAAHLVKWLHRFLPHLLIATLFYVGSYVCLSAYGCFISGCIGAGGAGPSVKAYDWAPAGFVKNYRHLGGMYCFYFPLYLADRQYWHNEKYAYLGKYPISTPTNAVEWAEWRK